MTPDSLLTIEEASKFLNVSKTSLRRWTKLGQLPCVRIGARQERRFKTSDLQSFLIEPAAAHAPTHKLPATGSLDPLDALDAAAAQSIPRHVCLHYRTPSELWALFLPYVKQHLERDAPMFYIHREGCRDEVIAALAGLGYDAKELIAQGRLTLLEPSQAYLRDRRFSAQRMIEFMDAAIQEHIRLGFGAMLIAGEMSWYLSGADGVQEMIPYEDALNSMLLQYPDVTIVCQYDINRLSAEVNLGAICSHTHVHMADRFVQGFYGK
ncbi:MAG: MEDS domain-containing protein [Betaproteobacteria bacterium]|nr:MEDS domain-containing protein [Betaproteobacteria bacterium]